MSSVIKSAVKNLTEFPKRLNRRIKTIIVSTGLLNWSQQQLTGQYNQLYARSLGANSFEVGLLNGLSYATSSLASLIVGWLIEQKGYKRVVLLGVICSITSAALFASAFKWWVLIPAFMLMNIIRIMPITDIIIVTYTPFKQRGLVMGFSRSFWGILNLSAPLFAAWMVTIFGGIKAQGIRPLYYVQLILILFVFFLVAFRYPSREPFTEKMKKLSIYEFIRSLKELIVRNKSAKKWVMLRYISFFSMGVSMPFIPIWMVEEKGATPYILGLRSTAYTIVSMIAPILAGKLTDKLGRKKAYYILSPITYIGVIILILAPKPEYLILSGIFSGFQVTSFIPFITMFWESVSAEERGKWYAIEGLLTSSMIMSGIVGGIMWQLGLMVQVLILPVLLGALVMIPLLSTIPEVDEN
ncbi:MAG: MFS transporter [archaeon GB-1867-035]|nr:MFS transporter [Candidatus Culexmicrobium profundum]